MVAVRTAVHPRLDLLALAIESKLIDEGRLAVRFAFPYGSPSMQAAEWKQPARHQTKVVTNNQRRADLQRTLDRDEYFVAISWEGKAKLVSEDTHSFLLTGQRGRGNQLEFVAAFSPHSVTGSLPAARNTFAASEKHWPSFWTTGGAVELSNSRDKRAAELERRVVLSQYLTAIQCSGSRPPQETGLTVNSWYGKFHLEMHWWHASSVRFVEPLAAVGEKSHVVRVDLPRCGDSRAVTGVRGRSLAQDGRA